MIDTPERRDRANTTDPLSGLDRLIQGTAMLDALTERDAHALLDGVAEAGANSFDLARDYGAGEAERRFGAWFRTVPREQRPFLVGKGGHPHGARNRVARKAVRADLDASLDAIGSDYFDLYLLHRDDPDVPVDEIVDFLDELQREGRIGAYGGSNWTVERLRAAHAYAQTAGRDGFRASSPHFSLAVPTRPPWPGCVALNGPAASDDRRWYAATGLPVLAWSSLAMGWFALESEADVIGNERSLGASVYATPENVARRARARRLAERDGGTATEVAVRYVLNQPMRTRAIVGCRTQAEFQALKHATERPLSASELEWLESGTGPDLRSDLD